MEVAPGILLRLTNYQLLKEKEAFVFNPEFENVLIEFLTFLWETGNNLSYTEFLNSPNGIIFYGIVMAEIEIFRGYNDLSILFSNNNLAVFIQGLANSIFKKES